LCRNGGLSVLSLIKETEKVGLVGATVILLLEKKFPDGKEV
jgi:hypothetical protein